MANISTIKKVIVNSLFLRSGGGGSNISGSVCFSSSPTYSEGYHASNERTRKPDYDKGFNDDRTVADAGERILEMTEKTRRSMEESMAKTAKKIKEAKKQEETSKVRKTKQKMQNAWRKVKERTQKIKQSIVGKWDNIADHKKSIEDYIEDHTGKKDRKKKM